MTKTKRLVGLLLIATVVAGVFGYRAWLAHQASVARLAAAQETEAEWGRLQAAESTRLAAELKQGLAIAQAHAEATRAALGALQARFVTARAGWRALADEVAELQHQTAAAQAALAGTAPESRARARAEIDANLGLIEWMTQRLANPRTLQVLNQLELAAADRNFEAVDIEAGALESAVARFRRELASEREARLQLTGSVRLTASPGDFDWELRDAFGQLHRGLTPGEITGVAVGPATVRFTRPGWPPTDRTVTVERGRTVEVEITFPSTTLFLDTIPSGVRWKLTDARDAVRLGTTPATLTAVAPGPAWLELDRGEWPVRRSRINLPDQESSQVRITLSTGSLAVTSTPAGALVQAGLKELGRTPFELTDVPTGTLELSFQLAGFEPLKIPVQVAANGRASLHGPLVSALKEKDYATVWLFRPKWVNAYRAELHILINGQPGAVLTNGTYHAIRLKPGRYTMIVDPKGMGSWGLSNNTQDITLEPGQTYYYECAVAQALFTSMTAKFAPTPATEARAAIASLKGSPTPQLSAIEPR